MSLGNYCVGVLGRPGICEGFLEIGVFCAGGDMYRFGSLEFGRVWIF